MIEVESVALEDDSTEPVSEVGLHATHATPPLSFALTNRSLLESDAAMIEPRWSSANATSHTVVSGECLWRIARSILRESGSPTSGASISALWQKIYDLNREAIGSNPSLIFPGQVLVLPER